MGGGFVALHGAVQQVGAWRIKLVADALDTHAQGGSWYRTRWIIQNHSHHTLRLTESDFSGGSPQMALSEDLSFLPINLRGHLLPLSFVQAGRSIRGDAVFPLLGATDRAAVRFQPLQGNPTGNSVTWTERKTMKHVVILVP